MSLSPTDQNSPASPEEPCGVCAAYIENRVTHRIDQSTPGCLVWRCPVCDRAWPRYDDGDRGNLAQSLSVRLNRGRRSPSGSRSS